MNIQQWPEQDRPREKLLHQGAKALTDSELVAILINCGTAKSNALDLARALISRHKGLPAVLNAPSAELYETSGIGPAKYVLFQTVKEVAHRLRHYNRAKSYIRCGDDAKNHFVSALSDKTQESFACLFLGYEQQILGAETLSEGTINTTQIHVREVASRALKYNASTVILGHNHPTGVAKPSKTDILATHKLQRELEPLQIFVVDHIIIAGEDSYSFCEQGLL